MNKEEILQEIEKTKEHLANMEKMLKECEYERWNPKPSEAYYCIDEWNDVRRVTFTITSVYDRDRVKAYNCFQTRKQAEVEAEKILVRRRLENIARRLNKGQVVDWYNKNQSKHCIELFCNEIISDSYFTYKAQGTVYCLDKNFKDVAIQEIGEERLKAYLKDE